MTKKIMLEVQHKNKLTAVSSSMAVNWIKWPVASKTITCWWIMNPRRLCGYSNTIHTVIWACVYVWPQGLTGICRWQQTPSMSVQQVAPYVTSSQEGRDIWGEWEYLRDQCLCVCVIIGTANTASHGESPKRKGQLLGDFSMEPQEGWRT